MLGQVLLILEVVAPVILVAAVGYAWARTGAPFDIPFITRLTMNVAGPCLLFSTLVKVDIDRAAFEALAFATFGFYALMALGSLILLLVLRLSIRAYLAPVTFANTGNVGLPVALFAFGEEGLALALIVFALMAVLTFTLGVWMVSGRGSPLEALKQPIFYGAALGAVWAYQGWGAPEVLLETLTLIGQIMIPLMLLTLGVSVARLNAGALGRAFGISLARTAIAAAAAVYAAQAFALPPVATGVLVIQAIMPVAVTSYLLSERYQAEPQAVAGLVVVSTLVCLITAPLTLAAVLPAGDGPAPIMTLPTIAPPAPSWSEILAWATALWESLVNSGARVR